MKNPGKTVFAKRFISSLLVLVCLLTANSLRGQNPYFRTIKTSDEIQQSTITCLFHDLNSYMWIGTTKGLYQYDGNTFKNYPVIGKESTSQLQVSAIYMTADRNLWVGTRKGEIYNMVGDSLQLFTPEEGNPKVTVTAFVSDPNGNLWFSTYGEGIYYFDGKHIFNINTDDGLTDNFCYTVSTDVKGRVWAATDGGISICRISKGKKYIEKLTTTEGLPDNIVLSLTNDSTYMWVGMQEAGFCKIDMLGLKITIPSGSKEWNSGPVANIVSGSGWKWLSTEKNGVFNFNSITGSLEQNYTVGDNNSIARVNHLYADKQGNYWIATGNQLLISTGQNILHYVNPIKDRAQNIHCVLIDSRDRIWFSDDSGLHIMDQNDKIIKNVKLPFKTHTHIISLYEDEKGLFWAGTFGNGMLCMDHEGKNATLFDESDGLSNGNILSITGKGNRLWLATLGGAIQCDISGNPLLVKSKVSFLNYEDQHFPGNNYIYSVLNDSKNRVWFATDGKGISMLDKGRYVNFDKSNGLKSNIIYSIAEDSDGLIWFSTSDAGIYCYDGKTFINYMPEDGLSDIHITGLLADKHHHLLIIHNNGIDIMDTHSRKFVYYSGSVGLSEINPDLNSCAISRDGVAWFGTQNGLKRLVIPQDINSLQPDLKLDRVALFMGKENYYGTHEFSHKQNHISFHFNALWHLTPNQVKYQIRLKGYDLDWIDTRNNLVSYSNLSPGKYTFEVRYTLKGDFSRSEIKSYDFIVNKPFWKTNWFIILAVILAAGLIFLIIHLRDKSMQHREAIAREKIIYQFQTLQSQVNPHFLFNSFSTLISIIDEDKNIAIDFVEKLSQFFRDILDYRDQELIPMTEELKLINTYYYLQKKRYCENLQLQLAISESELNTLVPPMVLQMLVENAIKHNVVSAENPLVVKIYTDSSYIWITNNLQPKKSIIPSTGIGLVNIRNRYSLLGFGEISIEKTQKEFIIKLPLIHSSK